MSDVRSELKVLRLDAPEDIPPGGYMRIGSEEYDIRTIHALVYDPLERNWVLLFS